MALSIFLICVLVKFVIAEQLISTCPGVFEYDEKPRTANRYYATAVVTSDVTLSGVWFTIGLDKQSLQVGNWFGQVDSIDNNSYLVQDPRYRLEANTPLEIRFCVRYNPNGPIPRVISLKLNNREVCATERPHPNNGQFLNKRPSPMNPLAILPPSEGGGNTVLSRPNREDQEDDFFHGDYLELNILEGATCGTVVYEPQPLIINGQATQEGQFPWHAALYHTKGTDLTYMCGASLISMKHLITVAHCVTRRKSSSVLKPDNLMIYLGKFYLDGWKNPGVQNRRVDTILVHPKYNPQTFRNDIAILKLGQSAKLTNYVRPICLWEGPSQLEHVVGSLGTVVGWGFDETGTVTKELTKASMPIVSQETCIYSYPEFFSRFTNNMTFCSGFQNGTSVCNGDSGGGLILPKPSSDPNNPMWQIRGLVSISVALQNRFQCDSSHYVVFTDVAKYLDFINKGLLL